MELRSFGSGENRLTASVVGLGCNNFGRRLRERESRAVIHAALDAGITLFDTAESYGNGKSEKFIGNALGPRRRDVLIATKFGWSGGASRRKVTKAVEGSLKRLRTDVIDLYQLHRPDPSTPIEETLEALDALVRQGKVRFVGCSNFSGEQIERALDGLERARLVRLRHRAKPLEPAGAPDRGRCRAGVRRTPGMGILPYYPLANGLAERQVQARRGVAERHPPLRRVRAGFALGGGSSGSSASWRRAGGACWSSRSHGWPASRAS